MKSRGPLRLFVFAYYSSSFHYCIFYSCPKNTRYSFSRDDDDADDRVAKPAATDSPGPEAAVRTKGLPQLPAPILEAHGGSSCPDKYTDRFDDGVKKSAAIRRSLSSSPPDPPTQPNEAAAAQLQVDKRSVVAVFETELIPPPPSARALEGSSSTGNSEERPKPSDCLTLTGACTVLLINIPARGTVESRLLVLYYAHITLLGLALFLSIGLYVSSICDADDDRGSGAYRRVQKRTTMAVAVSLVAASIVLRVAITLPAATTKYVLPPFLGGAVLVLATLCCLLRKKAGATTTGQAPRRIDL